MQEDTLQALRDYLQKEHMKDKQKRFSQQVETIYYVQGPTTRYNKYYRLWCICMHVLQLHPK